MSLFFWRKNNKRSKEVKDILRITQKVIHYRKDVLSTEALQSLANASIQLSDALSDQNDQIIQQNLSALDKLLRKHGGQIYPQSSWGDHVETIVVGVILLVSIRAFFVQNFKIPTNSMYPSFGGMVPEVFSEENPEPNALMKIVRKALFFADHYEVTAEEAGEFQIVMVERASGRSNLFFEPIKTKSLFILPRVSYSYEIAVGNKSYPLTVPADFDILWVFAERLGVKRVNFNNYLQSLYRPSNLAKQEIGQDSRGSYRKIYLKTGLFIDKGEDVLNFDIITGDMLFVDRFTYHFRSPKVGEPIVFPTKNVENIPDKNKYYIKRMVGQGGDTLEVKEPVLYRNGKPIEGAAAFVKNAEKEGEFDGYQNAMLLSKNQRYELPPATVFAMGDNSDNSEDSRFFGPVPQKEVIGRAIFVYYPFTERWGISK